jgi:hypothetical protein
MFEKKAFGIYRRLLFFALNIIKLIYILIFGVYSASGRKGGASYFERCERKLVAIKINVFFAYRHCFRNIASTIFLSNEFVTNDKPVRSQIKEQL